jgi:hypothetical protein
VDGESELPPAASPVEVSAERFQSETPQLLAVSAGQPFVALQGGQDGLRAWAMFELPEAGLYTLSVFGRKGAGQRWMADHCLKAVLCPSPQESGTEWWVVTTANMAAGPHAIAVNLGPGASVERIRLERKKDRDEDYVATLRRLGFDVGPAGDVPRPKAVDAMEWVQGRRRQSARVACGDVVPRGDLQTQVASQNPGGTTPPGGTNPPGTGPGGPGNTPGGTPDVPLPDPQPSQPPGSAVTIAAGDGR